MIAFEAATGRVQWRAPLCRLAPGKFAGGFAERRRNRIRSFTSPPLYHEGTVYYNTNAGAVAAIDGQSGRVKWLTRYPYYIVPESIHDATRVFGGWVMYESNPLRHPRPTIWYNQRPLLVGEDLYVGPVDTPFLFRIDRRDGRVQWSKLMEGDGAIYSLGPTASGELVLVSSGRANGGVRLLDPKTGETTWRSPDPIEREDQPALKYFFYFGSGQFIGIRIESALQRHDFFAHKTAHHRHDQVLLGSRGQLHD